MYGVAIELKDRKDEVKLSAALTKLMEEDPSVRLDHSAETHQMVLWGQGEMHLRVAIERLKRKYGIEAGTRRRQIPYKETIRGTVSIRGRHKKQSGGHGQFGDVVVEIKPLHARRGLSVRRHHHRRRGAEAVHSLGRDRRARLPFARAARVPGGRCRGDADRRLVSQRRQLRHGVPAGRPSRDVGRHAEVQPGAARAGDGGRHRGADRGDVARSTR